MSLLRPALAVVLALTAWSALAQQSTSSSSSPPAPPPGASGHEHHGPPPESLAACKSLTSGAACSFTSPRGTESGTCGGPEGKPLACRPQHHGQQGQGDKQGPPPKPAN